MLSNPPYGVSWKKDAAFVEEEAKDPNGRFFVGLPRISDGSLLFLQHLIHKMSPDGSRIGIVFNGSPLFTGDAGQGETEIRKWVIENDLLETIIMLPDKLFFNTGITTYIWILTNKKENKRKNKIQLINGSNNYGFLKKKLGEKNKQVTDDHIQKLFAIYTNFEESEDSLIMNNQDFGYTRVTIDQPLIENGEIKLNKNGSPIPDKSKRNYERVPLGVNIDNYLDIEVKPFVKNYFVDKSLNKIGYEISLTKLFYKFEPLIDPKLLEKQLHDIDTKIQELTNKILND